jgi:myo-inositol-1(or 4)-monophosphatase
MIRVVSRHIPLDASPATGHGHGARQISENAPTDADLLDTALRAARRAAEIHRDAAGTLDPGAWGEKNPSDFVTEVDRESERHIVDEILGRFPDHRILAEEGTGEEATGDGGVLWIVDPLDGTTNFLHDYPEYAASIAALDSQGLRAGVVLNAATGEEYAAVRGRGATLNGSPIEVSGVRDLRLSLIGTGFPFKRTELIPDYLETLGTVLEATSGVRRAGAAALDLCAVACGRLDAFWEHWLMPWDVAAGAIIVREAGGTFGALPVGADHALAGPSRGGEDAAAAFSGTGAALVPGPGAFLAGNGLVDDAFRSLLRRTLGG